MPTAHVWDIADGRVTRCEVFLDRSKALRTVAAASWFPNANRLLPRGSVPRREARP